MRQPLCRAMTLFLPLVYGSLNFLYNNIPSGTECRNEFFWFVTSRSGKYFPPPWEKDI